MAGIRKRKRRYFNRLSVAAARRRFSDGLQTRLPAAAAIN
ncbi:hypothetical protein HMPREF9123_1870 [Neisseria bacilliformis ATCC BAA-1200]|uniref:Uncharacterized protein n=1 Tax=Neisseria bacilliformis ATCC BAA-1200 TaxID=888742 RepID=F2BDR4_9NEIS|nr:hypothetical protein HMPREF9123_1870 [Neisseria bacilliformis ATCC BAA-1200]